MSIGLMAKVFYTGLPSHLRFTLLALADFADDDGGSLYVGQRHLALRVGTTDRTIRANLAELVRLGYLRPRRRAGQRGVNRYRIVVDALPDDAEIRALKEAIRPDPRPEDIAGRDFEETLDRKPTSALDRKPTSALDRKSASAKPSVEPSLEPSAPTTSREPAVVALVERFAQQIADAGVRKYKVTDAWYVEMERLIRIDGRSPEEIRHVMDWLDGDDFWRPNVLTVPKFREKFDRLRLLAKRTNTKGRGGGGMPSEDELVAAMRRARGDDR